MRPEPVFTTVNQELLVEKLLRAERHACYVGPGIHDWAAEALIGYSGEGEHRFRKEAERRSGAKANISRSEATLAW